jgi:hypothetical protein
MFEKEPKMQAVHAEAPAVRERAEQGSSKVSAMASAKSAPQSILPILCICSSWHLQGSALSRGVL